jgi:hypothetical protein
LLLGWRDTDGWRDMAGEARLSRPVLLARRDTCGLLCMLRGAEGGRLPAGKGLGSHSAVRVEPTAGAGRRRWQW